MESRRTNDEIIVYYIWFDELYYLLQQLYVAILITDDPDKVWFLRDCGDSSLKVVRMEQNGRLLWQEVRSLFFRF